LVIFDYLIVDHLITISQSRQTISIILHYQFWYRFPPQSSQHHCKSNQMMVYIGFS